MKKKVISMLLVSAMAASLFAGCGSNAAAPAETVAPTEAAPVELTAPEELTIMVDGTLVATQEEGQDAFVAKLQELTGIKKINIVQPDHSAYYDNVSQMMADAAQRPDVILLGSTYYASYASEGILWDMTSAYEASDLKARHEAKGSSVYVDSVRVDGNLYGMPFQKGGGCITYVRQSWLDAAGISTLPTNFAEYLDMLRAFKAAGLGEAGYVIGAAGFVGGEAPYVNYWPEFYQDAYPTFVQQADGTWVDGFTQDSMKAALQRLSDGVAEGLIDLQSLDQSTSDARNKFAANEYGAYTYWANHWAANLTNNIAKADPEADPTLVQLPPIKEVGQYINRLANVWCIVDDGDGDDTREASIFKYFIETMQDGADCQFLWTYGVEDVHYSFKAGTVLAGSDKEKTYEDGTFHWLEMISDNSKLYSKMHITAIDALTSLANDPLSVAPEALAAGDLFAKNCKNEKLIPNTEEYSEYNGDLTTLKNQIIAEIVTGQTTIEAGYARFESEGAAMSQAIVDSLNALN